MIREENSQLVVVICSIKYDLAMGHLTRIKSNDRPNFRSAPIIQLNIIYDKCKNDYNKIIQNAIK